MSMWHSARLLYVAKIDGSATDDALREESIRIFKPGEGEDPEKKAGEMAKSREHDYKNDKGETVRWEFVRVLEIQELTGETPGEGMEVYSRMITGD